jgi:hypothetical protein
LKQCDTLEKKLDVIRITQEYTLPAIDAARKRRVELSMEYKL